MEQPLAEETYHGTDFLPSDFAPIPAEQVVDFITSLDTTKANGADAFMLKSTANSIASQLAKLFSLLLSTGKFPKILKIASVVPVPKSDNTNYPSNYRPISLLSVVSKLLERIVYSSNTLLDHSPISGCQWGFQKQKSTTTALLSTTHEWFKGNRMLSVCSSTTDKRLTVFLIQD